MGGPLGRLARYGVKCVIEIKNESLSARMTRGFLFRNGAEETISFPQKENGLKGLVQVMEFSMEILHPVPDCREFDIRVIYER